MLISTRPARPSDREALGVLATAFDDEIARERGGRLWQRHAPASVPPQNRVAGWLDDATRHVVVATIDEVVLGYAVLQRRTLADDETLASIDELMVDEQARDVGLGSALAASALEWAEQQGCIGVDSVVLPGMRSAKNFFEGWGFTARALVVHRPLGPRREAAETADGTGIGEASEARAPKR